MCRSWKTPTCVIIASKPYDDNAVTRLRHTLIGSVQQTEYHIIGKAIIVSGGMVLFQQRQVIFPCHGILLNNFGMLKLKEDVIKIGTKGFAKQTFDIFKDKRLGLRFTDCPYRFREYIPFIIVCLVLFSQRKTVGTADLRQQAEFCRCNRHNLRFGHRSETLPSP